MKRFTILILSIAMILSLTACGNKKIDKETKTTKKVSEKKNTNKVISGKELVKNVHARKAISLAIDKNYLVENIIADGSKPVNYFVPKEIFTLGDNDFRSKNPEGFLKANEKEAKKEWAIAKKDLGFAKASVEILIFDDNATKKVAEYIQSQLKDKLDGLTVTINMQPKKNVRKLANEGKFDIEYTTWFPDYKDPMTFLELYKDKNVQNRGKFHNDEYNKIIVDATSGELSTKDKERWSALQKAEEILIKDEAAIVPLSQKGFTFLQKPYVKGIVRHAGSPARYRWATTTKDTNGKKIIRNTSFQDLTSLDTSKLLGFIAWEVAYNCQENLVMLNDKYEVIPGVAKSWDVSKDKKTYTFHLRDSKWSNGKPVTANDFVYSFQRLADPNTKANTQFMIATIQIKNYKDVMMGKMKPEKLGVYAKDDKTVVIELERPVHWFLKTIALANFAPINKEFALAQGDKYGVKPENMLYNGAYTVTEFKNGYGYTISKNPKYWDIKNVKNDGVSFRIIKDMQAGVNLYEKDQVDSVVVGGEYKEKWQDSKEYITQLTPRMDYLIFNIANDGIKKDDKKTKK